MQELASKEALGQDVGEDRPKGSAYRQRLNNKALKILAEGSKDSIVEVHLDACTDAGGVKVDGCSIAGDHT